MFSSGALFNYLNDLVLHLASQYLQSIGKGDFNEEKEMTGEANKTLIDLQLKMVGIDTSYYFIAQLFNDKSVDSYTEKLTEYDEWTPRPLISPKYDLSFFSNKKEKRVLQ